MAELETIESGREIPTSTTGKISPPITTDSSFADRPNLSRSMSPRKRRRSSKPPSSREIRTTPHSAHPKLLSSATPSPRALTGAAALADSRSHQIEDARGQNDPVSPNSAHQALEQLVAAAQPQMSKSSEDSEAGASSARSLAEVAASAAAPPTPSTGSAKPQANREADFGSLGKESEAGMVQKETITASPDYSGESIGKDAEGIRQEILATAQPHDENGRSAKAFTFPGPINSQPHRSASLPQTNFDKDNSPASVKRHKCPYCNTDFTRHHNLKSHLLTHSQEKPFSCDRCDSRFRRLHDLKRHAKLHTGERPHVCPKCDRSFARGDALARHNKGQGGCAGRRESVGSFAGDDRHDDSIRTSDGEGMTGIMYANEASHEPEAMDEDSELPSDRALPRIQRHDAPSDPQQQLGDHQSAVHSRQPSTYPPVAARPPATGQLYPPPSVTSPRVPTGNVNAQSPTNHYPPPSMGSTTFQSSSSNVFTQAGGMTESPKPLSPGAPNPHQVSHGDGSFHRNRSPSLSHHISQPQYRRPGATDTSPPVSLPPPPNASSLSNAPHLPPLHGLTPPESRYTLHSQSAAPNPLHPSASNSLPGPPPGGNNTPSFPSGHLSSANNSSSSHGTGQPGSFDRNHALGPVEERLWAVVESLSSRVERLEEEVAVLRSHQSRPTIPR